MIDKEKFKKIYLNESLTLKEVQNLLNFKDHRSIYDWAKKLNLPKINRRHNKDKIIDLPVKDIIEKYQNNQTLKEIAYEYNISLSTINSRLLENNISMRNQGTRFYVNHDYFNIIKEKQCRILGLLVTDGYIRKNKNCITFTSNDIELSTFIKNEIGGSFTKFNKSYTNTIFSEKIYNFVTKIGIVPTKSHIINFDFSIFNNNEKLLYSFLIGLIDGDGSIFCSKSNKSISLYTASINFKNQIIKFYKEFNYIYEKININQKGFSTLYSISSSKKNIQIILINKLLECYQLCGMLDRKYKNLLKLQKHIEKTYVIL